MIGFLRESTALKLFIQKISQIMMSIYSKYPSLYLRMFNQRIDRWKKYKGNRQNCSRVKNCLEEVTLEKEI